MTHRVRVEHSLDVAAPAAALWAYVTDWEKHSEWVPLSRVETVGGSGRGVGGKLRAWSGIGPVGFWDPLTVTEWAEHEDGGGRCALVHTGRVVKGDAVITVTALSADRSTLHWLEDFELGTLGRLLWRVGGGLVHYALGRALQRLAAIVEGR
ncbi:MAG TPA: SRPBCC family protein [Nocardioidaceae bacterium]|nr:SRPBCC family protein [Nocardioidaceae bacterium]